MFPCWHHILHHRGWGSGGRPLKAALHKTTRCVKYFGQFSLYKSSFPPKIRPHSKTLQRIKMGLEHCKAVSLICAFETLPNLLSRSWMRSVSFCLVKGQETQLRSEQEVKIAEHIFTAEHIKTEESLSPWPLENSSVETPGHRRVATRFSERRGKWKGREQLRENFHL